MTTCGLADRSCCKRFRSGSASPYSAAPQTRQAGMSLCLLQTFATVHYRKQTSRSTWAQSWLVSNQDTYARNSRCGEETAMPMRQANASLEASSPVAAHVRRSRRLRGLAGNRRGTDRLASVSGVIGQATECLTQGTEQSPLQRIRTKLQRDHFSLADFADLVRASHRRRNSRQH